MAETHVPHAAAIAELSGVLNEEQRRYEQLLTLARLQGALMTSHDLDGLQANARAMNEELAAAQSARSRRELLARELMQKQDAAEPRSLSAWLLEQPAALRAALEDPVQAVRRTAGELARENEMNRRLANFCLDLVEEEAALLRRCLLADPAGCYDRGAQPACNEQGSVLQRQA